MAYVRTVALTSTRKSDTGLTNAPIRQVRVSLHEDAGKRFTLWENQSMRKGKIPLLGENAVSTNREDDLESVASRLDDLESRLDEVEQTATDWNSSNLDSRDRKSTR